MATAFTTALSIRVGVVLGLKLFFFFHFISV
jgi:hypothetical protein